jgi:hypothetical protein
VPDISKLIVIMVANFLLGCPLGLVDPVAVAIAAVGEVRGLGRAPADRLALAAICLVTRVSSPCSKSGRIGLSATLAGVATTAWMILVRLSFDSLSEASRLGFDRPRWT